MKKKILNVWVGTYGSNEYKCLWWQVKGNAQSEFAFMYDMEFDHVYEEHLKFYVESEDFTVLFEKPER